MLEYFQKREKTYPQNVKGKIRNTKNIIGFICLTIFLVAPFLRWDRGPNSPNQAILIDIPNSRGYFFFIEMWPEEVYYLAALLIFAAVALFFITSLFGRVWCGYTCPQTVWTDIFIKLERLFQGDRNDRIKLDRKTFSFSNIWRKSATHLSWLLVSLITGIAFVNYFTDAEALIKNLFDLNLNWSQAGWALGIAGSTYIMAGFAREQVCNYMCPYSKFQSAMFDPNTLIVSYDVARGEPRGKHKRGDSFENRGHCIDCKQCVVVCPANIDIRNGLQMECIACGLCIDACNNVMDQVGLPRGLIRYDTEINLAKAAQIKNQTGSCAVNSSTLTCKGAKQKLNLLRPKTFYYGAILLIVGGFIIFNLSNKSLLKVDVIPDRNPIFVMLSSGDIRNGYTIKISNKTFENKFYKLDIQGINYLEMKHEGTIEELLVKAGEVTNFKVYVTVDDEVLKNSNGRSVINFVITDKQNNQPVQVESVFISK